MQYRRVGRSGLRVGAISVGGWLTFGATIDADAARPILAAAVEGGVNFIDLADVYAEGQAEEVAGRFLRDVRRSDLVVSSKVFWPMSDGPNDRGLSRKHVIESCEASLRRLGTDYLDLYFCHRWDDETPLEETARAMEDLVRSGKVLYWGTSVWTSDQMASAHSLAKTHHWMAPIVEQPRYNLLDRHVEREVMPTAARLGMGLVVWSPLAQGILTGKYNEGRPAGSRGAESSWLEPELTDANLDRVRKFTALAREAGTTPARLALAWVLSHPEVSSAIIGATSVAHVREGLAAADYALDDDLRGRIEKLFPL